MIHASTFNVSKMVRHERKLRAPRNVLKQFYFTEDKVRSVPISCIISSFIIVGRVYFKYLSALKKVRTYLLILEQT